MGKPREFWMIDQALGDDKYLVKGTYLACADKPSDETLDRYPGKFIHVIEHSAYLELKEQLARAEDLLKYASGYLEDSAYTDEQYEKLEEIREYFAAKDKP